MALVMALGVMTVLSASAVVVIDQTSANSRGSSRSNDDRMALALAEAGVNNAISVLGNQPTNNPTTSTLLPLRTTTYQEGSVDWSGTYDSPNGRWTITSVGKVRNTTGGPTKLVQKTLVAKVQLKWAPMQTQEAPAWDYVYVSQTGLTCDLTLPSSYTWDSPLYVAGDLCLSNGARINGGPIVAGSIDMASSTAGVGTSSVPVSRIDVGVGASGSCQYAAQHWHGNADGHPFCSSVDNVYATTLTNSPPGYTAPVPQWDTWYNNAMPGPKYACTTTSGTAPTFDNDLLRNNSVSTPFNLTPSTGSYSCKYGSATSPIGELSWDNTNKVLTARGTVFIDGSMIANNGTGAPAMRYVGPGTIYLSGTFILSNGQKLCSSIASGDCNWGAWNPSGDMLTIVAGCTSGTKNSIAGDAHFQGAIWSGCLLEFASNGKVEGPAVAPNLQLGAGASSDPWSSVEKVTAGMPGNTPVFAGFEQPSYQ